MTLGEKIREVRKQKKLTTTQLAQLTDLTQGYISHIENNRKIPSMEILKRLATVLSCDFQELGVLAGHLSEKVIKPVFDYDDFLKSLPNDDEREKYIEHLRDIQKKEYAIQDFKDWKYVQLEDFLSGSRELYANKKKLSREEIKFLISIFKDREESYPSDEKIEKEFGERSKAAFIIEY